MPLRYFDPWYVKYVFASRIEHKIAAQSKQHPDAQPILSGELSSLLAELNELKRGVLKGINDINLLPICDIRRQYANRPGYVLRSPNRRPDVQSGAKAVVLLPRERLRLPCSLPGEQAIEQRSGAIRVIDITER